MARIQKGQIITVVSAGRDDCDMTEIAVDVAREKAAVTYKLELSTRSPHFRRKELKILC